MIRITEGGVLQFAMTMTHIPAITYPTILIAVFANQLCLPIPSVLFLLTAGALVESGRLHLGGVILAGVVGSLLADFAWFIAGRRVGVPNRARPLCLQHERATLCG